MVTGFYYHGVWKWPASLKTSDTYFFRLLVIFFPCDAESLEVVNRVLEKVDISLLYCKEKNQDAFPIVPYNHTCFFATLNSR